MESRYKILKMRRSNMESVGFLSPSKRSWMPIRSTKHKFGNFTEKEVDEFIRTKDLDSDFYYLKTLI